MFQSISIRNIIASQRIVGFDYVSGAMILYENVVTDIQTGGNSYREQTIGFDASFGDSNPTAGHTASVIRPHTILSVPIYIY